MNPSIEDALEGLRVLYLNGGALVLLLDYDGTLTPIVARPEQAVLDPDTRRLLSQLASLPRVHVGVLSGRTLAEVKALVDLPGLCYAGAAGMELDLCGKCVLHPHARKAEATAAELIARLTEVAAEYPGAWIEDKRFACTVHFRDAARESIERLRAQVEEVARRVENELRIVEGPMALEFAPELGWNKGTAVRMVLDHLDSPQAMVIYAGDGGNDAEAFEAVAALSGITLGVGPEAPSTARFRLPDPAALCAFLSRLATALS